MIGKLILYVLAFIGALCVLGGGFVVSLIVYYGVIEPAKTAREERKQHKTNLKALKRHWKKLAPGAH